jgi:hypothetical protein
MNRLLLALLSAVLFSFSSYAMAEKPTDKGCGPPDDKPGGKPEKVTLLHCGCDWDGVEASMMYKEITVSSKSKGHFKHVAGSFASCFAGQSEVEPFEDIYLDFVRFGGDCQIDGPELGDPIFTCESFEDPDPVAGDSCGVKVES